MKKPEPIVDTPAADRARAASDKAGEFHFSETGDYVSFVAGRLRQSHMKYSNVAEGGGMSGSTVSNMASGKTRYPRFSTIAGILGALGYETVIRAGRKK